MATAGSRAGMPDGPPSQSVRNAPENAVAGGLFIFRSSRESTCRYYGISEHLPFVHGSSMTWGDVYLFTSSRRLIIISEEALRIRV
ncbi:uncharacterized protein LAJ45_06323 [Morchella importuna]|uniref:uncharacterized protein n=1 Tax=Morchella importuna TaxID=1174673 RepID=UPI001E8E6974|nr:uncharacterized protein LAJ45_06323 [Morchella importuna]KAH8149692.1 hypothetical protein LAJ45_06323 [Morchella importuna]